MAMASRHNTVHSVYQSAAIVKVVISARPAVCHALVFYQNYYNYIQSVAK